MYLHSLVNGQSGADAVFNSYAQRILEAGGEFRRAGLKVEQYMGNKGVGDQIRYALKRGIPYVAIIGPDEAAAGRVVLRRLDQNTQEEVVREQAPQQIKNWIMGN